MNDVSVLWDDMESIRSTIAVVIWARTQVRRQCIFFQAFQANTTIDDFCYRPQLLGQRPPSHNQGRKGGKNAAKRRHLERPAIHQTKHKDEIVTVTILHIVLLVMMSLRAFLYCYRLSWRHFQTLKRSFFKSEPVGPTFLHRTFLEIVTCFIYSRSLKGNVQSLNSFQHMAIFGFDARRVLVAPIPDLSINGRILLFMNIKRRPET